ncbi:hypothetical protein [Candidatus Oscillochloris fontis]|uniref:hypothetical protein n=1 Tax=Candidatus Oscillochloris fontis TaxID=2496868 RepID=UPI00101D28ED|nr:hypothetical protein [Candidatus Oscillochloris fontis]
MRPTLQPVLNLLDDGLNLYRREFPRFAMIAAIGTVPMVVLGLLLVMTPFWLNSLGGLFLFFGLSLLSLPVGIYLMGAISRATVEIIQGKPIILREVLRIGPLRLLGMSMYGGVYLIVLNTVISFLSAMCICPSSIVIVTVGSLFGRLLEISGGIGAALGSLILSFMALLFMLLYGLGLVVSGATVGSLIFSLQPFVQGDLGMKEALRRSMDLLFYRLGSNLLIYLCASLIFGTLALCVTVAVGVLLPMPLLFLFGSESVLGQVLSVVVVVLALTLALPPLPIWMALLYQRRMVEREGADLAERIAGVVGEG